MSRINVLEVRYAAKKEGPWGEPEQVSFRAKPNATTNWGQPHDFDEGARAWRQCRVVPYERVEVREGRDPPNDDREVLAWFGAGWEVVYYSHPLKEWVTDSPTGFRVPDEWRELPEVPK